MLEGNTNTYTVVEQKVDPILVASKVRFIPYSTHVRTVCMRVDLLGCPWHGKYYLRVQETLRNVYISIKVYTHLSQ